jgi:hypothetical protein
MQDTQPQEGRRFTACQGGRRLQFHRPAHARNKVSRNIISRYAWPLRYLAE